ncbi:MAG: alpha-glucan family phosphorylase, partial [Candidatus Cloacimonetes bacterium]|nr:alpha-glucan family phosphorylase [Candidatus Cloacimonadota bacterium]
AYFSMEFGLHESLPIYSGGLGVLAGDFLKAASDQGVPLIAFGLLYKYGYFSQRINLDGMQEERYSIIEWHTKPVRPLCNDGIPILRNIRIDNQEVWFKTWIIEVGQVKLYLLDTDIPENPDDIREITDILYNSDKNKRIRQEILLAFGSLKLMKALDYEPTIYHLNEGHSAFLIVERLRHLIKEKGFSYREAREIIYSSTVFTTHTPVIDGNEHFDSHLIKRYIQPIVEETGISYNEFYQSGMINNDNSRFWLPALALRFARYSNVVSKIHGQVSRQMWQQLFPNLYNAEIPIKPITNGVHIQSWLSEQLTALFDRYIGPDYMHMAEKKSVWNNIKHIPNNEIWEAHRLRKEQMISFVRQHFVKSVNLSGEAHHAVQTPRNILHTDFLTIGFARRFAQYKRGDLILEDPERLLAILKSETRPVQFIFAGKAHPADEKGKKLIQNIITYARENNVEDRFVFVQDYDINIARHLVQGVDVWLNTPIRPMEASGTSGMKAGMNGALNLSVLDGWWPECYDGTNGWAITAGEAYENLEMRRRMEAGQIYSLIEDVISELYYDRDSANTPQRWISWMKNSMHSVGMNFNMHRMLREYVDMFYVQGIEHFTTLIENQHADLKQNLEKEDQLIQSWSKIKLKRYTVNHEAATFLRTGDILKIEADIDLDSVDDSLIAVEVFYLPGEDNNYFTSILHPDQKLKGNVVRYRGSLAVKGTGTQRLAVRVRALPDIANYHHYIKWFE